MCILRDTEGEDRLRPRLVEQSQVEGITAMTVVQNPYVEGCVLRAAFL